MTSAGGINSLAPKKRGVKISLLIAGVRRRKDRIVEDLLELGRGQFPRAC